MNPDEIYSIWAPRLGIWSPWTKPILFAHLNIAPAAQASSERTAVDIIFLQGITSSTCVVVDLPGADSIFTGVALAARGFRPVPLFNAVPSPLQSPLRSPLHYQAIAVDVIPIISAILSQSQALSALNLPGDAPPAFLLDSNRAVSTSRGLAGSFDNRSISLPTDFPSANLLRSAGISRIIVLLPHGRTPQPDLTHTLLRWQQVGIEILAKPMDTPGDAAAAQLRRPAWYRSIFHTFIATLGFRRHRLGGFGGTLPHGGAGG